MTDFITLAMQAGGTPTHHARNCAWVGYLWARVWAPPEVAEIWYLLAARMQVECERLDAAERGEETIRSKNCSPRPLTPIRQ